MTTTPKPAPASDEVPPMTDESFEFILEDHDKHAGCDEQCFWYKDRRYIARIRELEAELADTRSQLAHEESKEFWPR